jgi:hypothetical protein
MGKLHSNRSAGHIEFYKYNYIEVCYLLLVLSFARAQSKRIMFLLYITLLSTIKRVKRSKANPVTGRGGP